MPIAIRRQSYATMFGSTGGDVVRLALPNYIPYIMQM